MPRYFFDIADGEKFPDRRGEELPNDEAAEGKGWRWRSPLKRAGWAIPNGALS